MTSTRNFSALLGAQMARGLMVCVGLDSELARLPAGQSQFAFNRSIVERTHGVAQCYKIQIAWYQAKQNSYCGLDAARDTVAFIHDNFPEIPVIVDAKDGDVGHTSLGYVRAAFEYLDADALTINPYMGRVDGLQPFLDQKDKGVIVLCRTSNQGGAEFQDLVCSVWLHKPTGVLYASPRHAQIEFEAAGLDFDEAANRHEFEAGPTMPQYEFVAHRVTRVWNTNDNCSVVVGATQPDELAEVRSIVGAMPILIPGLGAQNGDAQAMLAAGLDKNGRGVIVNNSRGIIFADDPGTQALRFHTELCELRDVVMASRTSG